jgi:hypothetical protein
MIGGDLYPCGSDVVVTIYSDGSSNSSSTRYLYDGVTGGGVGYTGSANPFTVTMNGEITESVDWLTQYAVTFTSSGLGPSVGTAVVVTVNGLAKLYSDLPYVTWVDSGASMTYSYGTPLVGGATFDWVSTSGLGQTSLSNIFTVTTPGTITGAYTTRPSGSSPVITYTTTAPPIIIYTAPGGSVLPSFSLPSDVSDTLGASPFGIPNWIIIFGIMALFLIVVAYKRKKKKKRKRRL